MSRKVTMMLSVLVLSLMLAVPALAQKPDFGPHIYADGVAWGTKAVTELPASNGKNEQSFDKLFVVVNGVASQLPVAEAAPRNPMYNGGRWATFTVTWSTEPVLLTSYAEVMYHESMGQLEITKGSPAGGPPAYFECPLLPVK